MGVIEGVASELIHNGGWAAVSGLLALLVTLFYRGQFFKMWDSIEEKDKLLQENHERVLTAFEENTRAIQKMISHLDRVSKDTEGISTKIDKTRDDILKRIDRLYYSVISENEEQRRTHRTS